MSKFETIRNGALAALFSIVLTATTVGAAAVGPSHAVQAAPAAASAQA